MKSIKKYFLTFGLLGVLLSGCDEDEFEQSSVAFEPIASYSLTEGSSQQATVKMRFSRPLDAGAIVTIGFESATAASGVNFEIDAPSFVANEFQINIPSGSVEASFNVKALDDDAFTNGHKIRLYIKNVEGGVRSIAQGEAQINIIDNDTPRIRAKYDFESCVERFAIPEGFTEFRVPGFKSDRGWGCQSFGYEDTQGVQASGFGGESGTVNTWLLLNLNNVASIDMSSYSTAYIRFWVESFFGGAGIIELKFSTDYPGGVDDNPEDYTWTTLPIADQLPEPGSGQANAPDGFWKQIVVDASAMAGKSNIHLAFQYSGASSSSSASWTIDELEIAGE